MSLNFFKDDCKYPLISEPIFGICDDENGTKAYPDIANSNAWVAEVRNHDGLQITFIAIDKCILQDNEFEGRGRCDGMLTTEKHLYLVELKNQRGDWQADAKDQLISTIEFLLENHDLSLFKLKKAFACNKRRKRFAFIDNEENLSLFRRTGFRIDVQAEIVLFK